MKNELIAMACAEMSLGDAVLLCEVLQLLINKEITSFHFSSGLNEDTELYAFDLWQSLLMEKPPGLHSIVVSKCIASPRAGTLDLFSTASCLCTLTCKSFGFKTWSATT
jgi:hypothetical protein